MKVPRGTAKTAPAAGSAPRSERGLQKAPASARAPIRNHAQKQPAPSRGRPGQREERRKQILEAAARMFNRRGLHGATLAEVASDVGLATNSITYYFRRKEDLAVACLLSAIDHVVAIAERAAAARGTAARVRAFVEGYLALLAEIDSGRRGELVRFHDIRALGPGYREQVVAAYVPMFRRVRDLLGRPGTGARARRSINARTLLLMNAAFWSRAWVSRYAVHDYPRVAARITDILLHGLAVQGARWDGVPRFRGTSALADPCADATTEAFLRAATLLLNEQGYRGASVERISAQLKLTKGAFYHRHADKDELIAACFAHSFAVIRRAQETAALQSSGWQRVLEVAGLLTCHQLSESGPLLKYTSRSALPEAMRAETRRTMGQLTQGYGHFLVDGLVDGSIRPVDPAVAAELLTGTINAVVELSYWLPGFDLDEALDFYLRPLFFGLLHPALPAAIAPRG